MTAPVLLTAGDSTPGRLRCVDINLTSPMNLITPNWQTIQYIESSNFNPDDPTMVDATVFGDLGFTGSDKLGAGWSLALTLNHMITPGSNPPAYDPTHVFLEQNAIGSFGRANRVQLRIYDYDGNDQAGVITPRGQAYMGFANYSWPGFGDVGQADARKVQITFTGKGKLNFITHPYPATPAAPVIAAISPNALAANTTGKQVLITGSGFTTTVANGVKFGATAAPSYIVESDTRIVAAVPSTAAGTVSVTVQNAAGTSTGSNVTFS